jgi:uncharacterized protein YecE (DUF72 family)
MIARLRIGCPVWACGDWRGSLYTRAAARMDFLPQYASVFDAVEGSSSFYALPSPAAISRWRAETPEDFRFCFKFPSEITHRLMLRNAWPQTHAFLQLMAPLQERLGPLLIQLGPRFGPQQLDILREYLGGLSSEFCYAVEVRHPALFDQGPNEAALNELLRQSRTNRALIDTRCMHEAPALDRSTREAQARKPALPVRPQATARRPIVRFVGQNLIEAAEPYLDVWAAQLVEWLVQGLEPYFFAHTPDDRAAPELARQIHRRVQALWPDQRKLPAFPGESEGGRAERGGPQMKLF